nr:hypothetical protein CFP56_71556 [Quercus suber]
MASAQSGSSSSSSSSSVVPAMASLGLPMNSSLLLLSNMSSMMTVKLDYENYVVWKHQIKVILDTYSMIDVLDDSITAPDRFLKDSSVEELNALLNAEERVIKKRSNGVDQVSMAMAANFHSQVFPRGRGGRNYNQRRRGARGHGPDSGGMNSHFSGGNYSNFGGFGSGSQFQSFDSGNQGFPSQFQSFNQSKTSHNQGQN